MLKRELEKELEKHLKNKSLHRNVILIEGARQVGKTTLIQMTLKNNNLPFLELNLEKQPVVRAGIDECKDFKSFEQYLVDSFGFRPNTDRVLFIDEAQESEQLGKFVRSFKEDWENTTTIITGSALARLFKEDERYPVGRIFKLHLQPFSFLEFLKAFGKDSLISFIQNYKFGEEVSQNRHDLLLELLNQYIVVGGLPEVVTLYVEEVEKATKEWYKLRENLIYSYRDDFVRYFGIEKANFFERAIDVVAANVGSPSKDAHIAKPGTAGYRFAPDIYSQLENWKIIHKVAQKGPQPESTQFLPKRYLFDLGVLNYFRFRAIPSVNVDLDVTSHIKIPVGGVLENYLLLQLLQESPHTTGFKKQSSGSEIDFIFDFNGIKVPVECKAALKSKYTHARGLTEYKRIYKTKHAILFNLSSPTCLTSSDGIKVQTLPLYLATSLPRLIG